MATVSPALLKLMEKLAIKEGMAPLVALSDGGDWDPTKHPHGKHGYWAKKGEAVYHALMDLATGTPKKGKFQQSGHHTDAGVKVGGVSISPPGDMKGATKTIDYALHPGETAYKVQTPTSDHVVVTHADNSATELKATAEHAAPEVGKQYKPGEFQGTVLKNPNVAVQSLDTHQPQAYTSQIKTAKVGALVVNGQAAKLLPVGTVVRKRNAKYAHVWEDWEKQPDGSWTRTKAFKQATPTGVNKSGDAFGGMVDGGKSTFVIKSAPEAPAAPTPEPSAMEFKAGQQISKFAEIQALPVLAVVHNVGPEGKWGDYKKVSDDTWEKIDANSAQHLIGTTKNDAQMAHIVGQPSSTATVKSLKPVAVEPDVLKQLETKIETMWDATPGTKVTSKDHLNALPEGTILTNSSPGAVSAAEVIKKGNQYKSTVPGYEAGSYTVATKAAMANGHLTIKSLPPAAPPPPPSEPVKVPVGVPEPGNVSVMASAHLENHVGTSNKFYESAVLAHADGSAWHLTRFGSTKPGAHVSVNVKSYPSVADAYVAHDAIIGSKLKGGYSNDSSTFHVAPSNAAGYKLDLLDNTGEPTVPSAPEPSHDLGDDLGFLEEPPAPDVGAKVTADQIETLPPGTVLQHDVSGFKFIKNENGSWSNVETGSQTVGMKSAADKGHMSVSQVGGAPEPSLPEAHEETAPAAEQPKGPITVPGTGIELQPGQSLYQSSGNQSKWAIVEGGKVVQVFNKTTGEDAGLTKQGLWHWNQKLQKGQLEEVSDHGGGVPIVGTGPKVVAKAGAAKKAVPKVAKAKPAKPSLHSDNPTFTFSSGKVLTPSPGEHVLKPSPGYNEHDVAAWLLDAAGKVHAYDPNGDEIQWWNQKYYAPTGKKSVKSLTDKGAVLVASGPEKAIFELPVGKPIKTFANKTQVEQYAIYDYWSQQQFVGKFVKDSFASHKPQDANSIYAALEDPAVAQDLADAIATILAGREQFKSQFTASEKTRMTKTVKEIQGLLRLSVLMQKVNQPDHQITEQDEAELSEIRAIQQQSKLGILDYTATNWADTRFKQQKFLQGVKGLGFDPLHATPEQTQQYVANKGAYNAAGMSAEESKSWMLLDLGAPGASGNKADIEHSAGIRLKAAAVAANASAVAAKKAAAAPSAKDQATAKAIGAKVTADYAFLAKMHDMYQGPKGDLVWSVDTNTWYLDGKAIDALQAAEEVKNPDNGWVSNGNPIGSPAKQVAAALEDGFGKDWKLAHESMLLSLGANNSYNMSNTDRREWLRAFLRGDKIAQYEISAKHGSVPNEVPGSPNNPMGQVVRQTLSNYLAQQSWWHPNTHTDDWPPKDINAAGEALGVFDAAMAARITGNPLDDTAKASLMQRWIESHPDLPAPQVEQVSAKSVTVSTPGGASMEVQPGWLVAKTASGGTAIFADDKYWTAAGTAKIFKEKPYDASEDKVSTHAIYAESATWVDQTPTWAPSTQQLGLKVTKPAAMSQDVWDTATGVEAGGPALANLIGDQYAKMPDDDVAAAIVSLSGGAASGMNTSDRLLLAQAPDAVQRTAIWAAANSNKPVARDIFKALLVKARGGEYITPETQQWPVPGSTKSIIIPPGAALHQYGSGYALITGPKSGYQFDSDGDYSGTIPYYSIDSATNGAKLTESFANLTPEKAGLEGFQFTQASWDAVSEAEQAGWTGDGPEATAAYQFKQALKDIPDSTLSEQYSALTDKIHSLPPGVKAAVVQAAQDKNTDLLNALTWKIGKGFYAQQPVAPEHPMFDPGASYALNIASGWTSAQAIQSHWTVKQMADFGKDHMGQDLSAMYLSEKASAIETKLAEMQSKAQPPTGVKQPSSDPTKDLVLTYVRPAGGSHGAEIWTDQFGDEWVVKSHPHDAASKMLVDSEHAGNAIGKLFQFSVPQTFTRTINGKYSYVQHWDAGKPMNGTGPDDLNDAQLSSAMQSQVLNWLISNADASGDNLLMAPDGKTITALDLGQAGKHWGLAPPYGDKLAVDFLPKGTIGAQWYDKFFRQVRDHKIDRERAELVAQRVMFKAHQVATQGDATFEQHVRAMLKNRPKDFYPKAYPNEDALVAYALERKHNLVNDFEKLYKEQWAKAGWDWKIDTSNFGKKVGDAHVAVSAEYVQELADTKAGGLTLMQDTPDLADAMLIATPMKAKSGGTTLLIHGKLCEGADKVVTKWAKDRVQGPVVSAGPVSVVVAPDKDLPGIESFNTALVAYAITVGHHAPNGGGNKPDGQYNQQTVSAAKSQATALKADLDKVLAHREKDPTKPLSTGSPKFVTLEQQDAWVAAAQQKLNEYDMVVKAQNAGTSVVNLFPEIGVPATGGGFKPIVYSPTKDLGEPGEIAEKWSVGPDEYAVRTADGGHYFIESNGNKSWLSKDAYVSLIQSGGAEQVPVTPKDQPATVKWVNPSGEAYVQGKDGKWQLHDETGATIGEPLTQEELDVQLDADPDSWTYDTGEAAETKSVESKAGNKDITVTQHDAALHSGMVDYKTGMMVESKNGADTKFQSGQEYMVKYDGVTIRYRPWTMSGVKRPQRGNLNIEVEDWNGGPEQIEDVLNTLREMGVRLDPATEQSLQLHYWRHITEQATDPADDGRNPSNIAKVKGEIAKRVQPGMTQEAELQAYREAWAACIGQDRVDNAEWQPRFHTWFGQPNAGKPAWDRPTFNLEDLYKSYSNGKSCPIHAASSAERAVMVIQSGGLLAAEERIRILGNLLAGASSGADQNHGSSGFNFCRQHQDPWGTNSSVPGSFGFILDPRDALRSSTFAGNGDIFGDKSHYAYSKGQYDPAIYSYKNKSNEIDIKDGVGFRYLCPKTESQRSQVLTLLKQAGITEVNGMPIEQFVIHPHEWQAKMAEIWTEIMAEYNQLKGKAAA